MDINDLTLLKRILDRGESCDDTLRETVRGSCMVRTKNIAYSRVRDRASRLVLGDVKVDTGKYPVQPVISVHRSQRAKIGAIPPLVLEVYDCDREF